MSTVSNKPSSVTTAVRICPGLTNHSDDHYVGAMGFGRVRIGDHLLEPTQNDFVFGSDLPQEVIFENSVKRYIDKFLKGQDVSIMTCGAHLTGKSYTIFGPGFHFTDSEVYYGMVPKAISYIFSKFGTWDNLWTPYIKISMCEVYSCGIKDLFDQSNEVISNPIFTTSGKGLLMLNLVKRDCYSAMDAIQILRMGLSNRAIPPYNRIKNFGTAIVNLELYKPEIKGGEVVGSVISNAVFVDTACYDVFPINRNFLNLDVHILSLLAKSQGNQILLEETVHFQDCILFKAFQDFFNGKMDTFIIFCISPRKDDISETHLYLSVIWSISVNKPRMLSLNQSESTHSDESSTCQVDQSHISRTLMSKAANIFSRLSINRSVSEEDREMMRKWMEMKQDLVDESVNAQSHLQLERIEEVTESEEELASSDGKVSEQDNSEGRSIYESDQDDDIDHKRLLLSGSDSLDMEDLHNTFCSFVDRQVNTFEMQPVCPPMREQKPSCSSTRRGGLQHLPLTTPQSKLFQGLSTTYGNTSATQTDVSQNSTGAANTSGEEYLHQQIRKSSEALNQLPREQGVSEYNSGQNSQVYEQERQVADFARKCKITVDRHEKSATQECVLEENDNLTNLVITQQKLDDLVKKCQKLLQPKSITNKSKWEEGKRGKHFFKVVKNLINHLELLDLLASHNNGSLEADETNHSVPLVDHRLRTFRCVRDKVNVIKGDLHTKIKSKIFTEDELKSYLIADETVETLDKGNEFLNCHRLKNEVPYPQHAHLEVWKMAENVLQEVLTPSEINHILTYYFVKIVDLRLSTFQLEDLISSQERALHVLQTKISNLNSTVLNLRNQKTVRTDLDRYRPFPTKNPTNTLTLREEEEEGAWGGAPSTIPHQNLSKLQVKKRDPPPKVMRSHNNKKLVVELNRKKH